MFVGNWWWW